MRKEFRAVFQISKIVVFDVNYYTLGSNKKPHFSTSASEFIRSKRDYSRCGQAQEALLPKHSSARKFWEKWDKKHLHDLTECEYNELQADLDELKGEYNYIYDELDETRKPYSPCISFLRVVELSKQEPKTRK